MLKTLERKMLENFVRNVTYYGDSFDEKSFIGYCLDEYVWSDVEYWKLEADLLKIRDILDDLDYDFLSDLMRIIEILMLTYSPLTIYKEHEQYTISKKINRKPNIHDRYERLTSVLDVLFRPDVEFNSDQFVYQYQL